MRADNRGEGGILALMALAQRVAGGAKVRAALGLIGIGGRVPVLRRRGDHAGDLGAVGGRGLEVVDPRRRRLVLPISVVVILVLFAVQSRGTATIGRVFGPVMLLWFVVLGGSAGWQIVRHPFVLQALSPHYGFLFIWHHGWLAFVALGAVVLSVTGAEALYADMGHFGAHADPLRLAGASCCRAWC